MANLQLRNADDLKRLFSALGEDLTHESAGLTPAQELDQLALGMASVDELEAVDTQGLLITVLVAAAASWVAINAYERNRSSMGWGVAWGSAGLLFPIPAIAYTALKNA